MEVYLHKETFDIEQNPDKTNPNDFYLIQDELIAPSIQVLNRKGYTTTQCCSGHPCSDNPKYLPEYLPDSYIHYTGMSYIEFAEGISLPELPPGFILDPISINGDFLIYAFRYKRK